jgi:hypothetical protein
MIRENATPFVVPANAGTHNHRRLLEQRPLMTMPERKAAAYGSLRSRGRRCRHCEEQSDEAIHACFLVAPWIASLALAMTGCACYAGLICPTGCVVIWLSSPLSKNFSLRRLLETVLLIPPSRPTEGRIAIVTDAGRDAVDASGASDEGACLRTAKSCGPDASTLAFKSCGSIRLMTVTTKPGHRGEREGNR